MDIVKLPFNQHLGLARADQEGLVLKLEQESHLENHVGTVHAAALFALAEATGAELLLQAQGTRTDIGGVVRRSSCKYSRPGKGIVFSRSKTTPEVIEKAIKVVEQRGKSLVDIEVELVDGEQTLLSCFCFSWLLAKTAD